ncbi:type IV pilin N-terminal domain-containing protein [Natrinema sp. DC36]|uniref:type IV pilin n=1 Tax=Natrinema sp. DC36 TaxID=2878680 RepID=UPI001CEFC5DF|nr:type IV pilin N-terminal domain-containing protein [Natrinema sp. DC36]
MIDGKSVRQKLIGSDDERAVSPVIGVILMVAITVILAAVIAAFVLDMGQGQSQNPQAGFQMNEQNNSSTDVKIVSIDRLDSVEYQCDGGSSAGPFNDPSVGQTETVSCAQDNITIIGTYDGSETVMN